MVEEFRVCFEKYEISNFGNCRRKLEDGTYREIKGSIGNHGYKYFQVSRKGMRRNYLFHQMVMKAFVGDYPPGKPHIDHIDRNKLNNNLDNLRYCTVQSNIRNMDRFRDDIIADGKARRKAINKDCEKRRKEQKTYYCDVCNIACVSPFNINVHNNGYRHKLKCKYKAEMEKHGIEWNAKNYSKCKRDVYDFRRGRLPKPVVYIKKI